VHFHMRPRAPESRPEMSASLPPPPRPTSAELRILDPASLRFRRSKNRLQLWWEEQEEASQDATEESGEENAVAEADTEEDSPAGHERDRALESAPADYAEATAEVSLQGHWRDVIPVRLFPLSDPDRWVSILATNGRELGILADIQSLSPDNARLVREELERRYLVPQILAILDCKDKYDLVEWTVQTDRGEVTFLTRNIMETVQRPLPNRLCLTDVEGNRYDIPDISALDPRSRYLLEQRL
jgi:hypothetical protein